MKRGVLCLSKRVSGGGGGPREPGVHLKDAVCSVARYISPETLKAGAECRVPTDLPFALERQKHMNNNALLRFLQVYSISYALTSMNGNVKKNLHHNFKEHSDTFS